MTLRSKPLCDMFYIAHWHFLKRSLVGEPRLTESFRLSTLPLKLFIDMHVCLWHRCYMTLLSDVSPEDICELYKFVTQ